MSQSVGTLYPTLIPTLSDQASIVEAFQFYHLGLNPITGSYSSNSIEGHFKSINDRAGVIETRVSETETDIINIQNTINNTLSTKFIEKISPTSTPNVISPQSSSTIPLAIAGVSGQTANLQEWRNNAGAILSFVDSFGKFSVRETFIINGISGQTSNLQEWKNNSGSILAFVNKDGRFSITSASVISPTITSASVNNSIINNSIINDANIRITINAKTASYTLATDLSDANKMIEMGNVSSLTLTIPTDTTANYAIGTQIAIVQTGAGQVNIAGASGVVVNGTPGLKIRTQWSMVVITKRAANTWLLTGDCVA